MNCVDSLKPFFEPRGIVVVGARRSPGFGYGIPPMLQKQGWGDRLHLVNPAGGELHGLPVYKEVSEVPADVDLAVVIVRAGLVSEVLEGIGEHGIRHVVIESAGFAETGESGRAIQNEVKGTAVKYGIRIIGPNCVGVVNNDNQFATVELIEESLQAGHTAIIAQSGVFGNCLLDGLPQKNLFISKAVTLGNRMDVNECEILEYLHQDPATRVIMVYLEGASNGRLLKKTLEKVTRDKPVLVLKSGRTDAGRAATASHTGSLSGEDALYDSMFAQTGAIRAATLDELVVLARVFSTQPLPKGNRLGIVTSSGSLGALATDIAVTNGLVLPPLARATIDKVRTGSPDWMNVRNPLDVGPSGQFAKALNALVDDPGIDMVLAIPIIPYAPFKKFKALGLTTDAMFGNIASIKEHSDKPLVVSLVGNPEFINYVTEISGPNVPVLTSPEGAAKALAALWRYRKWRKRQQ